MVTTPTWLGAKAGSGGLAGQTNQFLGLHSAGILYSGSLKESQTTGGAVFSSTQTQWLQQNLTTVSGQTTLSSIQIQINAVGGSPTLQLINPLVVSLYADHLGLPTGTPLITTTLASQTVYSSGFWVTVPMPITTLTPLTEYHIVIPTVGTSGHYYAWQQSNPGSGGATSPDGITWTPQAFGFLYQAFDQSSFGTQVQSIVDDGGARLSTFTYNPNGTLASVTDYTVTQGTNAYLLQQRTLAYTNGLVTGVN